MLCFWVKNTALHFAAREGHAKAVAMLLSYNADIVLNKQQASFLHIALHNKRKEVVLTTIRSKRCVFSRLSCNLSGSLRTSEGKNMLQLWTNICKCPLFSYCWQWEHCFVLSLRFYKPNMTAQYYLLSRWWDARGPGTGSTWQQGDCQANSGCDSSCQHKLQHWVLMKISLGLGELSHQVTMPATKPEHLCLILRTHMIEGKNWLLQVVCSLT